MTTIAQTTTPCTSVTMAGAIVPGTSGSELARLGLEHSFAYVSQRGRPGRLRFRPAALIRIEAISCGDVA